MTEPKFTPGPWSINEWPQTASDIAIGAVGTPLITKVPLRDVSINEQKANANLIAAAPDLFNALLVAEESVGDLDSLEIVRAALAKARGEIHD